MKWLGVILLVKAVYSASNNPDGKLSVNTTNKGNMNYCVSRRELEF